MMDYWCLRASADLESTSDSAPRKRWTVMVRVGLSFLWRQEFAKRHSIRRDLGSSLCQNTFVRDVSKIVKTTESFGGETARLG